MLRPLATLAAGLLYASNAVSVDPTMARQLNALTPQERCRLAVNHEIAAVVFP